MLKNVPAILSTHMARTQRIIESNADLAALHLVVVDALQRHAQSGLLCW